MVKASVTLADGRDLIYYGNAAQSAARYPDLREVPQAESGSQLRWDPLLGEFVILASHRQDRTFQPAAGDCPLCPSGPGRSTEIPAPDYEVAVFGNRFPSLSGGTGRCEVVCFSPDHNASFADLTPPQVATVLSAWTDRSAVLSSLPVVRQVFCFENRGAEIGATLGHPHGQIYAYPFITPRTARMMTTSGAYRQDTGRNLFDDVVEAERADQSRIVAQGEHWTAFVPRAARWPYEVHLYPRRRVPDLPALPAEAGQEFCAFYPELLRRFDRLFDTPAPYVAAWHQAPDGLARREFALHLELFTVRRAAGKLKYLAGSESGMGAFTTDIAPEAAAARLRALA